ncbi:hypothetical protein Pfo_030208 [Paulownia fortunei]|nr:hypothetical protein Pfo_030208 [Paulownia fortunei]
MASLEDIVAATKILAEDSDNLMGGSGSKAEENRGRVSDVKQDDDGSSAAVFVTKRVVETETVVESTFDSNSGLGVLEKEKIGVLSSMLAGGTSVSVNGIDARVGVDVDGSSDGVVGGDEKIKDGEVSCTDNGGSWGSDGKALNGSGRKCSDADVDADGEGQGNGEKLEDWDHGFRVGDFVWGKIKSHPWWPGQVYDPRDASEFAVKHSQEGRLLVAFFGDGSCSWCLPSQLIPFVENFIQMSVDSSSKSFLNAVQRTVDEVGRLVESKMTCKCIPLEKRDGFARPVVSNAGVKAGVLVPEVDIHRLSVPEYEPAGILAEVMNFAKAVSVDSVLELAVLRSWLSAFYCAKGGYQLPVYCEPLYIEGLEDKNKNVTAVADDFSVPIEVPILGPLEDDWLSSPAVNSAKSQASSDDKIYHRRKQKSVAELMGENSSVKPKSQKRATWHWGCGWVKEGTLSGKPKEIEVAFAENTSGEAKEELENVSTPRERKKSKYLSPPYTNPRWRMGNSSSKMESESDKITRIDGVGKNMTKASGDLCASPPVSKFIDKESDEKQPNVQLKAHDTSVDTTSRTVENDKKMTVSVSEVNVSVNELLTEIQFAAVDPLYLSKEGSLDMVWAFVSALRSSTYLHGLNYRIYQKCKTGRKRKSLPSRLGNQENDLAQEKAKSPDPETPKAVKTEGKPDTSKSKKAAEFSRAKSSVEKLEGNASSSLILTFTPGFPLPSKEEIVRLFSKFESLNEKETNVVTDSHSVQIVFMKDSDAEAAFKSSVSQSPFGVENVNYWLQHSSAGSKSHNTWPKISSPRKRAHEKPGSSHPTDDFISDVRVIRQKLEIMTAILENYHSKFSPEDKSSLKDEMKHLMENVETVSEKVRVMAENTSS